MAVNDLTQPGVSDKTLEPGGRSAPVGEDRVKLVERVATRSELDAPTPRRWVDYRLHGLVTVRALDPDPSDEAELDARLGHFKRQPTERPAGRADITLRFVPTIETGPIRWIDPGRVGFSPHGFHVWPERKGGPLRIPLDRVGRRPELLCSNGSRFGPLLMQLVKTTALGKGAVAAHASAFVWSGTGVVSTGWSRGGKTSALLAFSEHGAEFIGDDCVFIHRDGQRMQGIPSAIPLARYRVRELDRARAAVSSGTRFRQSAASIVSSTGSMAPGSVGRLLSRLGEKFEGRARARLLPSQLFARADSCEARPDVIFLMLNQADPGIHVSAADPRAVAKQMAESTEDEFGRLRSLYTAFKFAYPGQVSPLLERAENLRRQILESALASKRAYVVRHPYPVKLAGLHSAMHAYVAKPEPEAPSA